MVFSRFEKKYLLDQKQYDEFMFLTRSYIQLDQHGKHTIQNVYYDNNNDQLARSNFQSPIYKEKLRLRCYGTLHNDTIEIKKKYEWKFLRIN